MSQDEIKRLEGRIKELEDLLGQMRTARQTPSFTPEEMQAYMKVRDALRYEPEYCGINECQICVINICRVCRICQICRVCRVCDICINECTCGPCNIGNIGSAGIDRFGGLGGD